MFGRAGCTSVQDISHASCSFSRTMAVRSVVRTQAKHSHAYRESRQHTSRGPSVPCPITQARQGRRRWRLAPLNTYPEPETEKERSTVDFPQEWITPQPSRRPDPMPDFEKLETPLPKKMPGDPEVPDEEEEEDEEKKKDPDEEDPEKEKPEQPPQEE